MEFFVGRFEDYHSIDSMQWRSGTGKKVNVIELGLFLPLDSHRREYFGLFYTGRKPSLERVMKVLDEVIEYGDLDYGDSKEEVEEYIKDNLKS